MAIVKCMLSAWWLDTFENGCRSFDIKLSKGTAVALMVAVDCRVGDICIHFEWQKYQTYLKVGHMKFFIPPGEVATLSNESALVTLHYEKGKKLSVDNRERLIRSYDDPEYNYVDAVLLLIAHYRRQGWFQHGSSVQELLQSLRRLLGATVFSRLKMSDQPADIRQIHQAVRKILDLTSILDAISIYNLRRGSAKDTTRPNSTEIKITNTGTARLLGHRDANMQQSIYNDIEDEAINVLKKDIKPGRTEDRALYEIEWWRLSLEKGADQSQDNLAIWLFEEARSPRQRNGTGRIPVPRRRRLFEEEVDWNDAQHFGLAYIPPKFSQMRALLDGFMLIYPERVFDEERDTQPREFYFQSNVSADLHGKEFHLEFRRIRDRTKRLVLQHHRAQWVEAAKADPTTTGMGTQPVPKPKDTTYIPATDILVVVTSHIGNTPSLFPEKMALSDRCNSSDSNRYSSSLSIWNTSHRR
ncbi:hypothetical protein LTR25_006450 [Vermiconidia calcicola]|uniref:Uncharacterized protein n=1 Tax=Vermiconidia calcicola TaxID=1690605 RepID=A0AAV9Q599_9PEZI|nr:hypothetical protein LTR25_006450 [Vermiconidia calcicola]